VERTDGLHGFMFRDGQYTLLDVPGAARTYVQAINSVGQMAGYFRATDNDNAPRVGFVLAGGVFTPVRAPGTESSESFSETYVWGIDDALRMVGQYSLSGMPRSFVLAGGTWTDFQIPGASETVVRQSNTAGMLIGSYTVDADGGLPHAFVTTPSVGAVVDQP
jgi:hypothetical protein